MKPSDDIALRIHEYMKQRGLEVGDRVNGLTFLYFRMDSPPSIINIGRVSMHWREERDLLLNIGADDPA